MVFKVTDVAINLNTLHTIFQNRNHDNQNGSFVSLNLENW